MSTPSPGATRERFATIDADGRELEGILRVPEAARGLVVFAHGSGSGRLSPRNQYVARALEKVGLGTLLIDLLSAGESQDRSKVFNIPLLAERLDAAASWLERQPEAEGLALGYFGASTGGGAALVAAAQQPGRVRAVVSRGGRPDLAGDFLGSVRAPTLLIVGGRDTEVLRLNEDALARIGGVKELAVIEGATHLFPEPGALEEVARLAGSWFVRYLDGDGAARP